LFEWKLCPEWLWFRVNKPWHDIDACIVTSAASQAGNVHFVALQHGVDRLLLLSSWSPPLCCCCHLHHPYLHGGVHARLRGPIQNYMQPGNNNQQLLQQMADSGAQQWSAGRHLSHTAHQLVCLLNAAASHCLHNRSSTTAAKPRAGRSSSSSSLWCSPIQQQMT
jgi:hypothetical protein